MDSGRYLERIGFTTNGRVSADRETLARLQRHHLLTVPFTNFYVKQGDGTALDPKTTVPRIISGGGLCYDLNGSFAWLLEEIGYDVRLLSGRVRRDDGSFTPAYDHLKLLVNDYVVDVGFRDFARRPLPLHGEHHTDVSGTYRVSEHGKSYATQQRTDEGRVDVYRFDTIARDPDEFAEMVTYHASSPDSHFAGDLLATRATEDGRVTLSGETLTITIRGTPRKQTVSKDRLDAVLRDRFGLPASDRAPHEITSERYMVHPSTHGFIRALVRHLHRSC